MAVSLGLKPSRGSLSPMASKSYIRSQEVQENLFSGDSSSHLPPRNSRERLISTVSELSYSVGGVSSRATSSFNRSGETTEIASRVLQDDATLSRPETTQIKYRSELIPQRSGEPRRYSWYSSLGIVIAGLILGFFVPVQYVMLRRSSRTSESIVETLEPLVISNLKISETSLDEKAFSDFGSRLQRINAEFHENQKLETKRRELISNQLERLTTELNRLKAGLLQLEEVQTKKFDSVLQRHEHDFNGIRSAVNDLDLSINSKLEILASSIVAPSPTKSDALYSEVKSNDEYVQEFEDFRQEVTRKLRRLEISLYQDDSESIDWARASLGARIELAHTSPVLGAQSRIMKIWKWGQQLYRIPETFPPEGRSADIILGGNSDHRTPTVSQPLPGNCFSFLGSTGNITIVLPTKVAVHTIKLEHIPPAINPNWGAAPKKVEVYLDNEILSSSIVEVQRTTPLFPRSAPAHRVASFEFDYPQNSSYFSSVKCEYGNCLSRRVRLEILSNHGNQYTCVYRLRVYGDIAATLARSTLPFQVPSFPTEGFIEGDENDQMMRIK